MPKLMTLEEGILLTQFARQTIERYLKEKQYLELPTPRPEIFDEYRGVFVTLKKGQHKNAKNWVLRGCIGHLQPAPDSKVKPLPLIEATRQAALSSAFEDPRFPPLKIEELESTHIEVSVLTPPEEVDVDDRATVAKNIVVGRDGLIIQGKGWHRGLLLPQVAPEQGWSAEQFLQGCCQKAGLPPNSYLNPEIKIFKFQAQIFAETSVKGKIIERTF